MPTLVTPPSIAATLYIDPADGFPGHFAFVGDTVTATPGTWYDPDGTPTVTGQWVDVNDAPVAAENAAALVIPASAPGTLYGWKETVTEGGNTAIRYHNELVVVVGIPAAPVISSAGTISGFESPGATLTKPTNAWYPASGLTIAGEWIKNGAPTGVIISTYADTLSGDSIVWRETATDGFDQSGIHNSAALVVYTGLEPITTAASEPITLADESILTLTS